MSTVVMKPDDEDGNDAPQRGEDSSPRMAPPNRIAQWRELRGLTQEQLAERIGKSKSLISLWETGNRQIKTRDAIRLAQEFGVDLSQLFEEKMIHPFPKVVGPATRADMSERVRGARDLPVRGYGQGGERLVMLEHESAREHIERPTYLEGVDDGFAVYMVGMSMFPALRPGWPLFVHPGQPPRAGDYVLIALQDHDALVKELVKENHEVITVRQYNPERTWDIPRTDIKALYRIRGAEF